MRVPITTSCTPWGATAFASLPEIGWVAIASGETTLDAQAALVELVAKRFQVQASDVRLEDASTGAKIVGWERMSRSLPPKQPLPN
jgi:hypothetical protein